LEFQSKSDIVSAYLREMIITGELAPNAPLRQRQLAEEFGVSPTPVREALRRLETEGLVHYDLHRGATVIGGALGPTEENYWVRAALEPFAARLAASRVSDEELEELEQIHQELKEAVAGSAQDRDRQFADLNRRFHFHIYTASRSPLLLALLRLLWQAFSLGPLSTRSLEESVDQHQLIVDALKARDPKHAEQYTRQHIMEAAGYTADGDGGYYKDGEEASSDHIFSTSPQISA
jgi:DNA-binding GntR family transcriptional regulator